MFNVEVALDILLHWCSALPIKDSVIGCPAMSGKCRKNVYKVSSVKQF